MKKYFLILFLININLVLIAQEVINESKKSIDSTSDNDAITLKHILKLKTKKYANKESGIYLNDLKKNYEKILFITSRPFYLHFVRVFYSKDLMVDIHIGKCSYLNRYNEQKKWDLELFKKEKILEIKIRYKGKCIRGCKKDDWDYNYSS